MAYTRKIYGVWHTSNDANSLGEAALLIASASDITVEGYSVPNLTAEQITEAYNAIVRGRGCIIVDHNDVGHFFVNQADSLNDDITVEILYYSYMLVSYTLSGDTVTVTGVKLGGGSE